MFMKNSYKSYEKSSLLKCFAFGVRKFGNLSCAFFIFKCHQAVCYLLTQNKQHFFRQPPMRGLERVLQQITIQPPTKHAAEQELARLYIIQSILTPFLPSLFCHQLEYPSWWWWIPFDFTSRRVDVYPKNDIPFQP